MNCVILIPAYNADNTIKRLIDQINNMTDLPVLIVDDGSKTPVSKILHAGNVRIHRLENNCGKGAALNIGLSLSQSYGYTHAITLDSDLQHPVKHIPAFLAVDEQVDLVIGRRCLDTKMPIHRRISNFLTSFVLSMVCSVRFSDSQCGYRRYRLKSLTGITFQEHGFMFESEVLIKMFRGTANRLAEVPVDTVYNNEASHIHNVSDTLGFIRLIIRSFVR